MKPGRMAAWAVTAATLPLLAACGGSGGSTPASQHSPDEPPVSSSAPQTPAQPSSSASSGSPAAANGAGGLTRPGAHLAFGQQATVGWNPNSTGGPVYKLQVMVKSIEKGSISEDFKNIELSAKEKADTPYYVALQIKALGGARFPSGENDPALGFNMIDDRGQQQEPVVFFGTFPRCDRIDAPKSFSAGKSYGTCLTFLIPGGGSIKSVTWTDGPQKSANDLSVYYDKPIVWGAG
jgi:hypothetical protein